MSDSQQHDEHLDPAPDDLETADTEVERGLGTGAPEVLREAAREVRREEERLAAAAARKGTPDHWRDG